MCIHGYAYGLMSSILKYIVPPHQLMPCVHTSKRWVGASVDCRTFESRDGDPRFTYLLDVVIVIIIKGISHIMPV